MGYQKDVAAAVVFQASNQLRKTLTSGRRQLWESALERGLLGDHPLDQLTEEEEGSETWKNAVIFDAVQWLQGLMLALLRASTAAWICTF